MGLDVKPALDDALALHNMMSCPPMILKPSQPAVLQSICGQCRSCDKNFQGFGKQPSHKDLYSPLATTEHGIVRRILRGLKALWSGVVR